MASPATARPTPPSRAGRLERLVLLQAGEAPAFGWAAACFFFLLFSYYMLRPVRDEMGIRGDLDNLPALWTLTTLATLLATPLFAWLASRLPRRRFVPGLYQFFAANLILFWALLSLTPPGPTGVAIGYTFFVWVSVFNLLSTSVFWGFMADLFTSAQGKRLFAPIGVGGTVGAVAGSTVPATLSGVLGPVHLMLLSAVLLGAVAVCTQRLCRHFGLTGQAEGHVPGAASAHGAAPHASSAEPNRDVWAGFSLIARSSYLQLMVVYMLLFTMTTTLLYFEQARVLKEMVDDPAARIGLLARIDLIVNSLTLLMQIFVTGRLLTSVGVMGGLVILPALTAAGFAGLWYAATVGSVMGFQIVRRATHFAVDRPTREVLYTVLGPDAKYKSKSFIDTFVYRGGDLAGAWGTALLGRLAVAASTAAVPIALVWLAAAWTLGRLQHRLAGPAATSARSAGESARPEAGTS